LPVKRIAGRCVKRYEILRNVKSSPTNVSDSGISPEKCDKRNAGKRARRLYGRLYRHGGGKRPGDAAGDTMDDGSVVIHGSVCGPAIDARRQDSRGAVHRLSGGHPYEILPREAPLLIIGGRYSGFLGEYQAGGVIVVLQRFGGAEHFICNFCGNGMHGREIFVRRATKPAKTSPIVSASESL